MGNQLITNAIIEEQKWFQLLDSDLKSMLIFLGEEVPSPRLFPNRWSGPSCPTQGKVGVSYPPIVAQT